MYFKIKIQLLLSSKVISFDTLGYVKYKQRGNRSWPTSSLDRSDCLAAIFGNAPRVKAA